MKCTPSPDTRAQRFFLAALILTGVFSAPASHAQTSDRFLLRGLLDAEFFQTDAGSRLLSVNGGEPAEAARLRLLAAGDFTSGFQGFLAAEVEGGDTTDEGETEAEVEQLFVRYTSPGASRFSVDLGKIVAPFGDFSRRYLSNVNPLIGAPDSYSVAYPIGIVVGAQASAVNYRVAFLDTPTVNENYVPDFDPAFRPAVAVGITPTMGLRVGTYYTWGPYLGHDVEAFIPGGEGWRDFDQQVLGVETEFSRGYFELHADFAVSRTEVPTKSQASPGQAWFVEPKYTWTPRFFTALRIERNDYPYIEPISSSFWIASNALFYDVEAGIGWRFTPDLVVKASYRRDRWKVDDSLRPMLPDGHAFAVQLSYAFNVNGWVERPK